jgi:hypothetical protein
MAQIVLSMIVMASVTNNSFSLWQHHNKVNSRVVERLVI